METAHQRLAQVTGRLHHYLVLIWYGLRSQKTTIALLIWLAVVLLVGFYIPQQTHPGTSAQFWSGSLPSWLEAWGESLHRIGLHRVFHSIWFWLPVALLALNSLIALADFAPPSWRRARGKEASLNWQHPLAQRAESSARLPAAPDPFLEALKADLANQGFVVNGHPAEKTERNVTAARRQWVWWSVITWYGALLLLCGAFLISYYFLASERLTLWPLEERPSELFNGTFDLGQVDPQRNTAAVTYRLSAAGTADMLDWRLLVPTVLDRTLLLPLAIEPVLTIEARDGEGALLKLIPLQVDLPPATRLNLPLKRVDEALYFTIPSASLAFQISPVSIFSESTYDIQARRMADTSPPVQAMQQLGEVFEIDDLVIAVSLNHSVTYVAYRDPALPFYLLSISTAVASAVFFLFRPPWLVWLIPEVKGRGGQLHGVVEKPGSVEDGQEFLTRILSEQPEQDDDNSPPVRE